MRVAIIGGGIAGLACAAVFVRRGADVTIHEQAPALREVGAGLQITPNGARVLAALGVPLAQKSVKAGAVVPTSAITGRALARFDLSAKTYHFVHRADLIEMLAAACKGADIRTGARIENPTALGADLIVGADGLHSRVRPLLNGDDAPFFTGQVAWRAMIAAEADPVARVWMAPGRHVVTYPLRGGRLNIVAVQERTAWAAEGWNHPDDAETLRTAFADCAPNLRALLDRIEAPLLWGLFRHPIAAHWHKGNMALIGDAAHPTLPFLAQGANLALEDAWSLAAHVAAAPLDRALPAYQAARAPRVTKAIAAANANARNYHLRGPARLIAHTGLRVLGKAAPNLIPSRLNWLYDYDVTNSSLFPKNFGGEPERRGGETP
ncbi:MAG: FAD-dependent monooxygenase [Pseudomonadota bacterium]